MTPAEIFDELIPNRLSSTPDLVASFGSIFQFEIAGDDGGSWFIDFEREQDWVQAGVNEDADCTIKMKSKDFVALYRGDMGGPQAFMLGKLKVSGDITEALKLGKILG